MAEPGGADVPTGQEMHCVTLFAPTTPFCVPAGHAVQAGEAVLAANMPVGHAEQADAPDFEKVPVGQGEQTDEPGREKKPAIQAAHAV